MSGAALYGSSSTGDATTGSSCARAGWRQNPSCHHIFLPNPSVLSVAAMEEHTGVVPARKSKCMVPVMKSKVEAIATGVPIYGGGGNAAAVAAAVVAGFGVADSSLFDDNWCCTGTVNSTMAEVASPAPLPTWVVSFSFITTSKLVGCREQL